MCVCVCVCSGKMGVVPGVSTYLTPSKQTFTVSIGCPGNQLVGNIHGISWSQGELSGEAYDKHTH